jgi:hypothetical protein
MPVNRPRHRVSDPSVKILATHLQNRQNLRTPSVPACRSVAVLTAGVVVYEDVESPVLAHQSDTHGEEDRGHKTYSGQKRVSAHESDMHKEEDTMTGAGRASMVGPSSWSASQRRPVPYAVSYLAKGRFWVELGRRPFLGGRTRASIRSESPKWNLFSLIQIGRDDAASGAGACLDLARAGFISLGVPRESRTCPPDLGMCSAATFVPEALPSPGLHRRSCSVTHVQALTRHHSSASFPSHL